MDLTIIATAILTWIQQIVIITNKLIRISKIMIIS